MKRSNSRQSVAFDILEARTLLSAEVVGYLPWYQASNQMLEQIDWESLTHVNYFSLMPSKTGQRLMTGKATVPEVPFDTIVPRGGR